MGIEKRKKQMNVGGWWSSMKEEGEWKGEEREEKRGWFYFCIYFSCLKENKMKKGKSKQTKCNIVNKKKEGRTPSSIQSVRKWKSNLSQHTRKRHAFDDLILKEQLVHAIYVVTSWSCFRSGRL